MGFSSMYKTEVSGEVKYSFYHIILFCFLLTVNVLLLPKTGFTSDNMQPRGYPKSFTEIGIFDGVVNDSIVISDRKFSLAPGAKFNVPGNLNTHPSRIEIGRNVGYLLDKNGMIVSVWLLPDGFELK